jgi:RNA polymerase sigma-70 factor (TIGR02943 family)
MGVKKPKTQHQLHDPATWVERYGDYLYTYALRRIFEASLAEEIVQETFVAALKARTRFEGRASEKTWLTGILKHKLIDQLRRQQRDTVLSSPETDNRPKDTLFDAGGKWRTKPRKWNADPQKLYEQKAFMETVFQCMAGIPKRMSQAFALRELEGATTAEICNVFNISTANCWVILHRARGLMRNCLEKNWFGNKK